MFGELYLENPIRVYAAMKSIMRFKLRRKYFDWNIALRVCTYEGICKNNKKMIMSDHVWSCPHCLFFHAREKISNLL